MMSEIAKIVGSRIRIYRNRASLSQEQLAEIAGLHTTYIGQLERGEKNATIQTIEKIALALNLPMEIMFCKIIPGLSQKNVPLQCYDLINSLEEEDQKAMYQFIISIIQYKNS